MNHFDTYTDEQIIQKLSGDPEQYGIIIDRYTDKLGRYIRRISGLLGDEQDDVLQDVFVKAYEKHQSFDPSQSFNSWIYRICHNTTINYWKKNKRYSEGISFNHEDTSGFLETLLAEDSFIDDLFREADAAMVQDALGKLKEKYRSILILRFFEEHDYSEISDMLEIPPGTVATHIHRAKKALGKQIAILGQPKK